MVPKNYFRVISYVALLLTTPVTSAAIPDTVDVAIIGAGVSGLTAGKHLLSGGKSILILEARNRVGGKVLNRALKNGGVTEVGAEFVGPTQDHVLATISELGLSTFPTYNEGKHVFWRNNKRNVYTASELTGGLPPIDPVSLIQLAAAQAQLDAWAAEVDVSAPWTHPKAEEWDRQTFEQWINAWLALPDARVLLGVIVPKAVWSVEARELSLLYVITYIAAAGNETTKGTVSRLTSTEDGGQELRVEGGTGLIPLGLAEQVGEENIALNAAVSAVTKTDNGYDVVSQAGTVKAKNVVVAMPPPLVEGITFTPALPEARRQLNRNLKLGAIGKGIAVYKTPFWRVDEDLSGQVLSDSGAVKSTFDNSPEDASFGAIMGFICGDDMRELDSAPAAEVEANVTSDYVRYFGNKAEDVDEFILQRWDLEEWSKGGPTAIAPPNVLTRWGSSLRTPVDGIHWAGTETSDYWAGFMDGAIRAGERAAREILEG